MEISFDNSQGIVLGCGCLTKQKIVAKFDALKTRGFDVVPSNDRTGWVCTSPVQKGAVVASFNVSKVLGECLGENCDLINKSDEPLFNVQEIEDGKFFISMKKL